jgi:hypothetical protein
LLRCQIRVEPARRNYDEAAKKRLLDLFGTPERWAQTVRPLLWTETTMVLLAFAESTITNLPVPCSYDFTRAATIYFDALADGDIPLCFLFSGTVFYEAADRGLQVMQIPWEKEAYFRLPAAAWRGLMDRHHPNGVWLCLQKDVVDQLQQYKSSQNLPSWEQAIETLIQRSEPQA